MNSIRVLICAACVVVGCATEQRLNVVMIVVDDLGWTDTGAYGSAFYETPNIDRLAASGARFTQFYTASPVCSPTRAGLMTGKHPARVNITNWIGGEQKGRLLQADYERQLGLDEVTLGEAFHEVGYATGYIGKWHLGAGGFLPDAQGFDFMFAVNHAGQPGSYFYPYENPNWPITNVPDLSDSDSSAYLTDRLTDEAVAFLDRHRAEPFLLVLSHYAVHTPLQSKVGLTAKYEAKAETLGPAGDDAFEQEGPSRTKRRQDHPVYGGMIESTDESVGRIVERIAALGLDDRTVVVFVSDNGGLSTLPATSRNFATANVPLRAGKGWLYEGGIRAPLIVRVPGAPEGVVIEAPTISMDLYPTLLELARVGMRPEQHRDGVSLAPLLTGRGQLDRTDLFWHFPHYHGSGNTPSSAVRSGNLKLIEWLETRDVELYDLSADLGERRNLAEEMPARTSELKGRLDAWRTGVDARMPSPNPDWQ
jgi:arylsulfatase A-like enzyme